MIIYAGNIIVGDGITQLGNKGIYIDSKGKIKEIDDKEKMISKYPDEKFIDYKDSTILPGLFDMHVHLGYYFSQPDKEEYDDYMIAYYALEQAKRALSLGITTIRDVGSCSGLLKHMRYASEKGFITVPRIIHTDKGITMTGGHGHQDGHEEVDGVWNMRHAIRRQTRDGADWVKILTSNREELPEFTQEELNVAVEECHRRNIKIAAHAGIQPSIQMCIDAGFDTIEHGTFMTVEQAKQMVEKGQAWTPTMTAYIYLYEYTRSVVEKGGDLTNPIVVRAVREMDFFEPAAKAYKNNFKKLYDTGVTVLAGSDMVLYDAPPLPINKELSYMVEYGITPLQAIQTATSNSAKVLGMEKITGQIKQGLEADLLVVKGNVAENIKNLNNITDVYMNGKNVYHYVDEKISR